MKKIIFTILFIVCFLFSCKHTEDNFTHKIIKEEILKTKQENTTRSKSLDQIDESVDSIKNKDLPEINKKINDK